MDQPKTPKSINRYSDQDLEEFRAIIDKKLKVAKKQVTQLHSQAMELNESLEASGHNMDESNALSEVEFLNKMVVRQNKHIRDLENALMRIKNKNYGICMISGSLIDKRRLLAVPTTTKSLQSKNLQAKEAQNKNRPKLDKKTKKTTSSQTKHFTKILKKNSPSNNKVISADTFLTEEEDSFENELDQLDIEEIDTSLEQEEAVND